MPLEITEELIARQSPEAQAIIRLLLADIAEQDRRIAELEAEVRRLRKTPQNSSLPPSAQHPHAKPPRKKKPRSKRKRGGQRGHVKRQRPLVPADDCDELVPLKPTACRRCGTPLHGDYPQPLRHQVWELPEIRPLITEYQRHRLDCPGCGESTCAPLPPDVPTGQSGPRLVALTGLMMAYLRQGRRRTALFLETVFSVPCGTGLTVKQQMLVTQAARPAYEELSAALPQQSHISANETSTKEAAARAWLWTFGTERFTVYALCSSRKGEVAGELLTDGFRGVVSCDRAKMYWRFGRLQWCWAHLKRDFQALIDRGDRQLQRLGRDLLRAVKELFRQWRRYRDGTLTRRGLKRVLAPIRRRVEHLLLRGYGTGADGMCRELYTHRAWLWAFLDQAGVEPTNNASERSLRHAVIWRKLSFGTQSSSGSRFVETLLTVIETCRQQRRNVFAWVTTAVQVYFAGTPSPTLLPGA